MKNILIPIDGSEYSQRAMEKGKEMAKAFNSKVVLLNVAHITYPIYAYGHTVAPLANIVQLNEEIRDQAMTFLNAAKESFGEMAENVEVVLLEGEIAPMIVDYVENNEVDLIVMGSHGLGSAIKRFVIGSVTTKVLHHVKNPVLVIK